MKSADAAQLIYLLSAILFILGLKRMTRVKSARQGNTWSAVAMLLAVVGALIEYKVANFQWIIIGLVAGGLVGGIAAVRVEMTSMPEMVALFNGSGGAASAVVALSVLWGQVVEKTDTTKVGATVAATMGNAESTTLFLSIIIGGITLSGSIVAYLKLAGKITTAPVLLPGRHAINLLLVVGSLGLGGYFAFGVAPMASPTYALALTGASVLLGILLVIPIGGADMPVVISLLNSYSGVAASATGFVIGNNVLIIAGAMVGAAGLILTQIMCVAMNRSLANVIFGGFGAEDGGGGGGGGGEYENVTSCGTEEAAMILENATSVIFVPGYGLAVAQAQHAVREVADLLKKNDCEVKYAIHPVAGRMPGHMNVLLAEADIPYEELVEMDVINPEFANTDVAIVVGANDVVNPAALDDEKSPIYGMPILEVHNAQTVFVIKRGLGSGFAGVKNILFERDNTMMVFGDAKKVLQGMAAELKENIGG